MRYLLIVSILVLTLFLAKVDFAQAGCDYQVPYEKCVDKQVTKTVCNTCKGFSWGWITDCDKCGSKYVKTCGTCTGTKTVCNSCWNWPWYSNNCSVCGSTIKTVCDTCWNLVETCNKCWYRTCDSWWCPWWYGANCSKCGMSYKWVSYDCNCTTETACKSCWGSPVYVRDCAKCGSHPEEYTYQCNCTYEEQCKRCWRITNVFLQTDCTKCGSHQETFTVKECQTKYKTETITSCINGDNCCPITCNWFSDNDCTPLYAKDKPPTYYLEEGKCWYGCTIEARWDGWHRARGHWKYIDDKNPCTEDGCGAEGPTHYIRKLLPFK